MDRKTRSRVDFHGTSSCTPYCSRSYFYFSKGRGSNAFAFLYSIQSSEFLISIVVLAEVLGVSLPLARKLQSEYIDVLKASQLIEATIQSMQEKRDNSSETFRELYKQAAKLAEEMGTVIQMPGTTARQKSDLMYRQSQPRTTIA